MKNIFGKYIREKRELLRENDTSYSLRKVAGAIQVQPSYLSKIERGDEAPPSEEKIVLLANVLGEDPDVLLALAGKVSTDLKETIRKRPQLFSRLIREIKDLPDHAILSIVREVRDGEW